MKYFLASVFMVTTLLVVNFFVIPFKQLELYALYKMYQKGSGWDDGAMQIFIPNQERYSQVLLDMLNTAKPKSFKEDVAFLFADLSLDHNESIWRKLEEISESHPVRETRCFWRDALNGRYQAVTLEGKGDGKVIVQRIIDTGSECDKNP